VLEKEDGEPLAVMTSGWTDKNCQFTQVLTGSAVKAQERVAETLNED